MKKIDALLKKVELFEKLAIHGDRKSLLAAIAQQWTGGDPFTKEVYDPKAGTHDENGQWHGGDPNTHMVYDVDAGTFNKQPPTPKDETMYMPADRITAYPKIDPNVQDMLNRLLDGRIVPLKNDGVLGKNTRDALKLFKDTFKQPATVAAIKQEFNKLNQPSAVAREPGAPVGPMGNGLGGVGGETKATSPGTAGTEKQVEGPKA